MSTICAGAALLHSAATRKIAPVETRIVVPPIICFCISAFAAFPSRRRRSPEPGCNRIRGRVVSGRHYAGDAAVRQFAHGRPRGPRNARQFARTAAGVGSSRWTARPSRLCGPAFRAQIPRRAGRTASIPMASWGLVNDAEAGRKQAHPRGCATRGKRRWIRNRKRYSRRLPGGSFRCSPSLTSSIISTAPISGSRR